MEEILQEYENCSGQCINFGTNVQDQTRNDISQTLRVRHTMDTRRYLGLSSMVRRQEKAAFQGLKDRLYNRVNHWCIQSLSQWGKELFIKSILQLPTYSMSCFLLPNSAYCKLERIINKLWWQKHKNKWGIHWCNWNQICQLKEDGGMGFRCLSKFNLVLLDK